MRQQPARVLHFCGTTGKLGGIPSYIELLMNSELAHRFAFERVDAWWNPGTLRLRSLCKLTKLLKTSRPDLIHLHGLDVATFHAAIACRLAHCTKILLTIHGFTEDVCFHVPWKRAIKSRCFDPFTIRTASAAYCVSEYGARKPVFRRNVRNNLGHINNAVAPGISASRKDELKKALGFAEKDILALCVSRLSKEKGIHDLIAACYLLYEGSRLQPKLLLVGDGHDAQMIRQLARPLLERKLVVMPGQRDDVRALHNASDFFILPSLHENQSLAILDAMAEGRPVLATAVGGTPELVLDKQTGLLCPPSCPQAIAIGARLLAEDPELRRSLGLNAQNRANSVFSISNLCEKLQSVYTEMLNQP